MGDQLLGTFKQWLCWVIVLGAIPTAAVMILAQRTQLSESAFWAIGLTALPLYFAICGLLGAQAPGEVRIASPDEVLPIWRFQLARMQFAGKVMGPLQAAALLLGMPMLGAVLIYYGVRDGEVPGFVLGPDMVWASGGLWVLLIEFLLRRGREARQQ